MHNNGIAEFDVISAKDVQQNYTNGELSTDEFVIKKFGDELQTILLESNMYKHQVV